MKSTKEEFEKLYDLLLKEKPQKSDVIVWLQGDRYDRSVEVLKLYKEGWSKKILISGNNLLVGKKMRLGENNIALEQMKKFLLKQGIGEKELIVDSDAKNTKDQAEHILKLAKKQMWSKLILVGTSYYQPRAFLTFLKQAKKTKWDGKIVNQPLFISWDKRPSGRNKTARFLFEEEFEKINKYKNDLVSIAQGIKYLNKNFGLIRFT